MTHFICASRDSYTSANQNCGPVIRNEIPLSVGHDSFHTCAMTHTQVPTPWASHAFHPLDGTCVWGGWCVCVCACVKEREQERENVCARVCVCERGRERQVMASSRVMVNVCECVCVCVCV